MATNRLGRSVLSFLTVAALSASSPASATSSYAANLIELASNASNIALVAPTACTDRGCALQTLKSLVGDEQAFAGKTTPQTNATLLAAFVSATGQMTVIEVPKEAGDLWSTTLSDVIVAARARPNLAATAALLQSRHAYQQDAALRFLASQPRQQVLPFLVAHRDSILGLAVAPSKMRASAIALIKRIGTLDAALFLQTLVGDADAGVAFAANTALQSLTRERVTLAFQSTGVERSSAAQRWSEILATSGLVLTP